MINLRFVKVQVVSQVLEDEAHPAPYLTPRYVARARRRVRWLTTQQREEGVFPVQNRARIAGQPFNKRAAESPIRHSQAIPFDNIEAHFP